MSDPYRSNCPRCAELEVIVEWLKNSPTLVYPNQGPVDDEPHPRCVVCGDELKWQHNRNDWFCCAREREEIVDEGFLWWKKSIKKRVNVGCPITPHLHRTCEACDAEWVEMPYARPAPGSP